MLTDEQIEYWAHLLRYAAHNSLDQLTLVKICVYMTGAQTQDAVKIAARARQLDKEHADIIAQSKYN